MICAAASLPVETRIYTVRGQSVMLDSDLAEVYGVATGNLNKAVDRNPERFPEEFSFRLTREEWQNLLFQFGRARSWGGRRNIPRVFTEHGAVMLASVLNSPFAVRASIAVVQAFIHLRHVLDANRDLARKVDELSVEVGKHGKALTVVFRELEEMTLASIPKAPKERIGFKVRRSDEEARKKG